LLPTAESLRAVRLFDHSNMPLGTGVLAAPSLILTPAGTVRHRAARNVCARVGGPVSKAQRNDPGESPARRVLEVRPAGLALVELASPLNSPVPRFARALTPERLQAWSGGLWVMGIDGKPLMAYSKLVARARLATTPLPPELDGAPVGYWSKSGFVCAGMMDSGDGASGATLVVSDVLIGAAASNGIAARVIPAEKVRGAGTGVPEPIPQRGILDPARSRGDDRAPGLDEHRERDRRLAR
jgi:hypothetical protein